MAKDKKIEESSGTGRFFKKIMNPITHAKDLDDNLRTLEMLELRYKNKSEDFASLVQQIETKAKLLYEARKQSVKLIQSVCSSIKKVQNCPVFIFAGSERAKSLVSRFTDAWDLELEGLNGNTQDPQYKSKAVSVLGATGVLVGSATAAIGPSTLMALATTFGTASTGTAIASLSGAAASNAALAWIGGGTLAVGGAGTAGGAFILSMFGPIGLGVAGLSIIGSSLVSRSRNDKQIKKIKTSIDEYHSALNQLDMMRTSYSQVRSQLDELLSETLARNKDILNGLLVFVKGDCDFFSSSFPKGELVSIVSSTKLLAKMTNEEIRIK